MAHTLIEEVIVEAKRFFHDIGGQGYGTGVLGNRVPNIILVELRNSVHITLVLARFEIFV